MVDLNPDIRIQSFSQFYTLLKNNDFRYKIIQFRRSHQHHWTDEQIQFSKLLCFELFFNETDFELLWTDETTICPQNFQKKGWGRKGKQLFVESDLYYSKVKLFGLLSKNEVLSMQFIQGSSSHIVFDNFIIESLKLFFASKTSRSIPVLFLDNAPIHKSRDFIDFCSANGILLVFNLSHNPTLNPIELFWRFLKMPFKRMINIASP